MPLPQAAIDIRSTNIVEYSALVVRWPFAARKVGESMIQRCEIPIPPSANHIHRLVWPKNSNRPPFNVNTAEYEMWLRHAGLLIKVAMRAATTFPVRVRVEIHGGEGFPRSRDLDNTLKPILDCIRGAEILPNDRVMEVCSIVAEYVPARAKGVKATCWIEVEELSDRAVRGIQGEIDFDAGHHCE